MRRAIRRRFGPGYRLAAAVCRVAHGIILVTDFSARPVVRCACQAGALLPLPSPPLDPGDIVLLVAAGLAAGAVNAVAGGGSLISFPALLAAGLPPRERPT